MVLQHLYYAQKERTNSSITYLNTILPKHYWKTLISPKMPGSMHLIRHAQVLNCFRNDYTLFDALLTQRGPAFPEDITRSLSNLLRAQILTVRDIKV